MTNQIISALPQFTATQRAGGAVPYPIDVSALEVAAWQANAFVPTSGLMRPTQPNQTGFVYQASANGQTAGLEPAWPKTAGGTVVDGSLTWTAVVPHASGEDSVASCTWSQINPPDNTLTITSQSTTLSTVQALIGGGTSGNTYVVQALVTMTSGAVWPVQIVITIL